ncbi:MAG: hypothetical protein ACK42G_08370 [Candidatus Kapaibacteriota bacterium]
MKAEKEISEIKDQLNEIKILIQELSKKTK